MRVNFSAIVAPPLVLWYVVNALLSRFVGTCTQGDTDRFLVGVIFGAPVGAFALVLIPLNAAQTTLDKALMFMTSLLSTIPLYLYFPLMVSVTLGGHHLCGPEFDDYLGYSSAWKRYIPLLHVVLALALGAAALRSIARGRRVALSP